MNLDFKSGDFIKIKVKPNSSKSEIQYDNGYIAFLKSIPKYNKANDELIKLFKRKYKLKVEIVSGFTSKNKKLKII